VQYLKSLLARKPEHYVGHNPAGSWVIYGLLLLGLVTGASGYAVYNDIGGEWLEELHEGIAGTMLTLVIVHVLGVVVSSMLHRENLVRSMITGYKADKDGGYRPHAWHSTLGVLLLVGSAVLWSVVL